MVSKMQGFSIPSFASLPNSSLHVLFVWAPIFFDHDVVRRGFNGC